MINNLFSIFDPSTSIINLSWITIIFPIIIIFLLKHKSNLKFRIIFKTFHIAIYKEIKLLIRNNIKKGNITILISLFYLIFLINLLSLFPFIFTTTAHISISFITAITIWAIIIIIGWTIKTKHIIPP